METKPLPSTPSRSTEPALACIRNLSWPALSSLLLSESLRDWSAEVGLETLNVLGLLLDWGELEGLE